MPDKVKNSSEPERERYKLWDYDGNYIGIRTLTPGELTSLLLRGKIVRYQLIN